VILQKWIATEIAKDLIRLDQADSTITLLEQEIDKYVRQLGIQDRVLLGKDVQIANLNEIISNHPLAMELKEEEVKHWKKQYKKQKRQKFIIGGVAIGLVVLSLVAN
jgi:reverse gyrase